jgi:16S rRNA (cytosine1402-N4)-methyltransferase
MNDIWAKHISVLLNELINSIEISDEKQNIIVDCTLWMWGHFIWVTKKLNSGDIIIWFDADSTNLWLAKIRISEELKESNINFHFIDSKSDENKDKINIILINSNFLNIKKELENIEINKITWIYYDLGLSSLHLDEADRWFSFMKNGPLDMRLDKTRWITAKEIVNSYTASELRKIFLEYWEEPGSNKISHLIVDKRKQKKFETTHDLAEIIPWPVKVKARIFQALRIETNKELEALEVSLKDALSLLESFGIIFVISFHSLEDRITKQIFKKETRDCICSDIICWCNHKKSLKLLNKKPILPSPEEVSLNSRSRSAKARAAQKL